MAAARQLAVAAMSESLFSRSWYRVAPLTPRLRSHVQIFRHNYRGKDWHVVQDKFTGRHFRLSPEAYQLIGCLDGVRSLAEIWDHACRELGDHMPTQDEVIGLLAQLYKADLLQSSALTNISELEERRKEGKRKRLLGSIRSPMFLRIPLIDPDKFLSATMPLLRPFLGWPILVIWMLTVGCALLLALMHWPDLSNSFTDQVLSLQNVLLVTLIYPILKVIHEFGHAYLVKKWGGEVHEMGVILLVFVPIPYVEASSSLAFTSKYQRMLVASGGIMVEVFIAAVALLVWLNVEPGAVSVAAFNIMLIAGVSTLLFNGNPLLRFDAYYVLCDLLEIPNLGQKANRFLGYLCQRYLLGIRRLDRVADSLEEACWLFFYGILSFIYRIFISVKIILFVAGKFFFLGILLAIWAAIGMILMPIGRLFSSIKKNPAIRAKRLRLTLVIFLPIGLALTALLFYPLPSSTTCQGVTWVPEGARLHAGSDGFVAEVYVPPGSTVTVETPLIRLENQELATRSRLLLYKLREYQGRYELSRQEDMHESLLLKEALVQLEAELAEARAQEQALVVKAESNGSFIPGREDDLGHYYPRGSFLGYVLDPSQLYLRVVVPQQDIDKIRNDIQRIEVRLSDRIQQVYPGRILREVPAASQSLPSLALSLEGGGQFALDPREQGAPKVLEHLFQLEVAVNDLSLTRIEQRAHVRFVHQPEPLFWRAYRGLRRLLLSRFSW